MNFPGSFVEEARVPQIWPSPTFGNDLDFLFNLLYYGS